MTTKVVKITNRLRLEKIGDFKPSLVYDGYSDNFDIDIDKEDAIAIISFLKEAHNLKGEIYE